MGNWNNIYDEIRNTQSQFDYVRLKYLEELSKYTHRNTIAYYSSWLNKPHADNLDINDSDMNGFMNCVHELDCQMGLDLILHTPGGDPSAAEIIVHYLREKFNNDIRIIVPQLAMSAGTMIACAGKEIIMGRQSSLGPIDPQFNGIPAYNIRQEFEEAKEDLKDHPENAQYWAIKLQQYPAAFMKTAIDAMNLSEDLVRQWLGTCMFNENDDGVIDSIVSTLSNHDMSKIHGRHLTADYCKGIGLKVVMMEDDNELQDKILSVHHAYMITLDATSTIKVIENQNKKSIISVLS